MKKIIITALVVIIPLLAYLPSLTSATSIDEWGFSHSSQDYSPSTKVLGSIPEPIAWWDFNDGNLVTQGTIIDKMGNYNAINYGGAERGAKWINDGYEGGAINFDCSGTNGTADYCFMSVRQKLLPTASNYTFLFRLKVGDISTITGSRTIFQSYNEVANIHGGLSYDNTEANKITTGGVNWFVDSDNMWHSYAFVWGINGHYYYKDGVQIGYADGNFERVNSYEMNIGASGGDGPAIQMDEIKVYDQALTADQIAEEYNYNKLLCKSDTWSCGDWDVCSSNGQQTKTCTKTYDCEYVDTASPSTTQTCTYIAPTCTAWTYSDWGTCSSNGQQTRSIVTSSPANCTGGNPVLSQNCVYTPTCTSWTYWNWGTCSSSGQQTRSILTSSPQDCTGGNPIITQSCTDSPTLNAQGVFELIIPTGRDKGVLNNDKIKIDYYGSDVITTLYLNSTQISFGVDKFDIVLFDPFLTHQVVSFYPPVNSTSGDIIIFTSNNESKNVGYLKILPVKDTMTPTETMPKTQSSNETKNMNINDSDGDGVPNNNDYYPNKKSELIIKKYTFNYKNLGENYGEKVDFTIEIPKDLYLFYLNQNHTFTEDYQNITNFITSDDVVIKSIIDQINTLYKEKGLNPITLIYQLAGAIIYSDDKFSIKGWDEYPKYPIETLVDGNGDCEDSTFLLATLYKSLGIEPVLVRFDNHLGLATLVNQDIFDLVVYKLGKDFMADINSKLTNNKLIYLESTGNTNWDFGYMPEALQGKSYTIHILDQYQRIGGHLQQADIFSDISKNHRNAIAIKYLKTNGIIDGYPDGTFKPDNTVNRAELLKILVNGKVGKPDENIYKNCFPDVTTEWFAPYVCYAQFVGWVEGYPDGTFKPEQMVNKVEALKMLINSQGISLSDAITTHPFDDVKTTDWFAKYVSKAKEIGILEETGDVFAPSEGMRRGGISENLYRILIQ